MVEIELDGNKVSVQEGSMVMHAAEKAGTYIPHFCYHKKLSIAANCRMCLVDVEKAPKPMPACATPVTQGMIVRTKSDKAIKAQQGVMEFLLINHPLDCPICDQGGECQLQDLAVGYGAGKSRYSEEKRVVFHKNVGPLISMEEMSRCIHCTRCVRFGQEIAGQMELGMAHRGEHSEIQTFVGRTVDSELSGNMIDICPVGALTSKPFRYSARTWELSRRKSVSPHDSTGANLVVQVKNNQVMRVVPLENEDVNECWIADRDRFSYEALNSDARLTAPMIKQGGAWKQVDWTTALEYVANGLKSIKGDHGAASIGALGSAHSTVEELHLLSNCRARPGQRQHRPPPAPQRLRQCSIGWPGALAGHEHRRACPSWTARWSSVPTCARITALFAARLRHAARRGAAVHRIGINNDDWLLPIAASQSVAPSGWVRALADVAAALGEGAPLSAELHAQATEEAEGDCFQPAIGSSAKPSCSAMPLLNIRKPPACWHWRSGLASKTGASVGYLTADANTVGAQLVKAQPQIDGGLNAGQNADRHIALKACAAVEHRPGARLRQRRRRRQGAGRGRDGRGT